MASDMVNLFEVPEERFGWVLSRIELRVLGASVLGPWVLMLQ